MLFTLEALNGKRLYLYAIFINILFISYHPVVYSHHKKSKIQAHISTIVITTCTLLLFSAPYDVMDCAGDCKHLSEFVSINVLM